MTRVRYLFVLLFGCGLFQAGGIPDAGHAQTVTVRPRKEMGDKPGTVPAEPLRHPVLWHDPGPITQLDLRRGPGGEQGVPAPPFTFVLEDRSAKTPHFEARDGSGRNWSVELGRDARPEVAASRLLWAMGYFTDQDYVVWRAHVEGLRLRNAKRYVHQDPKRRLRHGRPSDEAAEALPYISDARFSLKIDGQRKLGVWSWRRNAFTGTQEMNGLRVMMALLNCWDLRDVNNPIVADAATGSEQFRVSGIAASFGKTGRGLFRRSGRDNAAAYARSRFITRRTEAYVDFATPAAGYNPFSIFHRGSSTTWVGRRVPRKDARWIGAMLGQLSHQQIEDAFWAAGYPASEVNVYADVVEGRIRALGDL